MGFLVLSILGLFITYCSAITKQELYPFGTDQRDNRLQIGDDVSSSEIPLRVPVAFYDQLFQSLFVNLNGHISFESEFPGYQTNIILPVGLKVISAFLADIDTSLSGNVFYRETEDPSLLDVAARDIQTHFPDSRFRPRTLFIATWDDVGSYLENYDRTNSFQIVLASDGRESYAMFLYPEDGIQWITSDGKSSPTVEDVPAQIGFDAGDRRRSYLLPASGNSNVANIARTSNIGRDGVWLFKIGPLEGGEIQATPNGNGSPGGNNPGGEPTSCRDGGQATCHLHADCLDHEEGFCCKCRSGYFGNGKNCLQYGEPVRANGKLSGNINGVAIGEVDMHAYVVTEAGRTYIAISRMPGVMGFTMQSLYGMAGSLPWLFGTVGQNLPYKNGFTITGGVFNRTAVIQFLAGKEVVRVQQVSEVQKTQGYMRMSATISGNAPNIAPDAEVTVDDYIEEFRRVEPGMIKAYSTHTYKVDGVPYRFTMDQTITYKECDAAPLDTVGTQQLKVTRNFVVFNDKELIVRYSSTGNYTGSGESTGCPPDNNCGANSVCLPEAGGAYRCECKIGFTGDGYRCDDQDECLSGRNDCDRNAQCINTQGSFECRCNAGFTGDGKICEPVPCNQLNNCGANAECLYDNLQGSYICQCRPGFSGDGFSCRPLTDCRQDRTMCDRNARCQFQGNDYVCVCNEGFRGDGRRCTPTTGETGTFMLFAQGTSIMKIPFNPTPDNRGTQLVYIPGQTAIGIEADCYSRYMYWTDITGKSISRARLDGSEAEVVVQGLNSPEGIAVDWVAGNMYWTDSGLDRIEVSRSDGYHRKTLHSEGLINPRAIVLDPGSGLLFWSDWNRKAPKIERSSLDGTGRVELITENLGLPNGLVIDFDQRQLCWADAGTMHIECANYEGRGRRSIYALAPYPFGLTYSDNVFYWTDWDMKSLSNIDRYGQEPNEALKLPPGGSGKVYGIATVKSQCPAGSNACVLNNGGCRFLCLPTPNGGRTCACPDDIDEEECNRINLL